MTLIFSLGITTPWTITTKSFSFILCRIRKNTNDATFSVFHCKNTISFLRLVSNRSVIMFHPHIKSLITVPYKSVITTQRFPCLSMIIKEITFRNLCSSFFSFCHINHDRKSPCSTKDPSRSS